MRARPLFLLALLSSIPLCLAACGDDESGPGTPAAKERPLVVASFEPLRWLATSLAGDLATVRVLTPAGEDPLHYEPGSAVIQELQQADLVLLNGAGAETWTDKVSLPLSKAVNTSQPFAREFIEIEGATVHRHGPGEEHTHAGLDPHVWLDPENLRRQGRAVHDAMLRLWPEHAEALEANLAATEKEIAALHTGFESLGKPPEGEVFVASHPAYNYIARRYGWAMRNLDLDPETMPGSEDFAQLRRQLAPVTARFLFWESEPAPEIAERFRNELGLESLLFSPAELLGPEELAAGRDFASVMRANQDRLRRAFETR